MNDKQISIKGTLKKVKSSKLTLFGTYDLRYFELIFGPEIFGYKVKESDKLFKKSFKFKKITKFLTQLTEEEKKRCDWKYGFKIEIEYNKYMLLFAETLMEKNKWENAFKQVIKKNTVTRVMSDMIDKRQNEIWSTGGVVTEYNNDLKSRMKNSEIGSIARVMANRFNIKVPDENLERASRINYIEKYLIEEKLLIEQKKIKENQEINNNARKNRQEKNEVQFNSEQSENNSNAWRSIKSQDFYEESILDEDGYQLPRKNILYPLYIEDPSKNKPIVDEKKVRKLKETLLGQPENKKKRSASNIKESPNVLVNIGEVQDWNYYNQNYEVIRDNGKEDYKNLKLSLDAIKKSHMKESDVINEKEINLIQNNKKKILINPENLLHDKNKTNSQEAEFEEVLEHQEKINSENQRPVSTNKNSSQPDKSFKDPLILSSTQSTNFIPSKILVDNSIPMNNFNLSQLEKDFVEKLKTSNLTYQENSQYTFNKIEKNLKIDKLPNNSKKIRQSEYFNFVKNIIDNKNSKLTSSIIIPQKNNSKTSKINIYGDSKKESNYLPEHFKEIVASSGDMINYKNSELVGNLNSEVINYFKQSQIISSDSESNLGINEFGKLFVNNPNENIKKSSQEINSKNRLNNLNIFSGNQDGYLEEEFSEKINRVIINQNTQNEKIKTKRDEKVLIEEKIKEEKTNLVKLPLPIHKVENIKFAQSDLLDDWVIE
jgi:hypothetical protein